MTPRKFRWSKVYESSEEELLEFLHGRNLSAKRFHTTDSNYSANQQSDHVSTIWCAEGSLSISTNDAKIALQPGDAVEIPAHTPYQTDAGISGFTYYQS